MKILALDLATATGWAIGAHDGGAPKIGTKIMPSTGEDIGRFLGAYHEWLCDMLTVESPDLVVFEAPILRQGSTSMQTARKLIGLANTTELVCYIRDVQCREHHIGSVKKFFAGRGDAKKSDMVRRAFELGWKIKNDNEADAAALWASYVAIRFPDFADRFAPGLLTVAH